MSRSFTIVFLLVFFASSSLAWGQSSSPRAMLNQPDGDRGSAPITDSPPSNAKMPAKSTAVNKVTSFDVDPLLRVLVTKGVLTSDEARDIVSGGKPSEQRDRLAQLLKDKGLISAAELAALQGIAVDTPSSDKTGSPLETTSSPRVGVAASGSVKTQAAPTRSGIAAIAPIRLLPIEPSKREGLIPDINLGSGARVKPYGFFKTSVIRDSSSSMLLKKAQM